MLTKNYVWKKMKKNTVSRGTNIINSTGELKRKAMKKCQEELMQNIYAKEGKHYDGSLIIASVANDATIQIILTSFCIAPNWFTEVLDANRASSCREFEMAKTICGLK